ncbi:MAG: BspA family leucine-rich repeat surface protein [Prevotella sp.]|nr:BspA family leucine-rich repeat surface protein [Prevotella sp.]
MKKLITILALACLGLVRAAAQEMYAVYTDADNTLTFYYDKDKVSRTGKVYSVGGYPTWYDDVVNTKVVTVKRAVFDPSFAGARPMTTANWFWDMDGLTEISGIDNLNTSDVTNMRYMFNNCQNLTSLDLSGFDTSNVTNMYAMFYNCESLTRLNLSGFNTSNVTDMSYMFSSCSSLTSLDLSGFNTSNVTSMYAMFNRCRSLTALDLSGFNTSNVTDMSYMFNKCQNLTSLDLSSFNTAKVTDMNYMFCLCSSLTTIYVGSGWSTKEVKSHDQMFAVCNSLVGGQGTAYDAAHTDKEYARIDGGAEAPGYFTAAGARNPYDQNKDGSVDVSDVTILVGYVLNPDGMHDTDYNLNGDTAVDISDVTELVSAVLAQ